jgi:hypothetical protein
MNKEIRMSKKSQREIKAEQRARQQRVRDEARNRRRPSRDDLGAYAALENDHECREAPFGASGRHWIGCGMRLSMAWSFKVLMSERAKRSSKSLLDVTQMACFHFGRSGISSQRDQQPFGT